MMNRPASRTALFGRFLDREVLMLTRSGALGRARMYENGASPDEQRKLFRDALDARLQSMEGGYRKGNVSDRQHVANTEELSFEMSEAFHAILRDGRFRIGPTQKALNLFLKYQWARGLISPPPHCPVDSIVLDEIRRSPGCCGCPICRTATWTAMDDVRHYEHIIAVAKRVARRKGWSLPEWELRIWQERT